MRIKTNANPELNLVLGDGLEKKGSNPASIEKEKWEFLKAAYATVKQGKNNEHNAVMTLGNSTFLFAYDEDSKQDVLFMDGVLVTDMKVKGNKINVYTTKSNSVEKSFEEKDLITKLMADLDKAIAKESEIKEAQDQVVKYFNTKKAALPKLVAAAHAAALKENKIKDLEEEIKAIDKKIKDKENELPLRADKKFTQNDKIVKKINAEIDALKAQSNAKEEEILAINAELDGAVAVANAEINILRDEIKKENAKTDKNEKKIAKYEKKISALKTEIKNLTRDEVITDLNKQITALNKQKDNNNDKIRVAESNITLVEANARDKVDRKRVKTDTSLKSKRYYREQIALFTTENEKIAKQLKKLNKQLKKEQTLKFENLGLREKFKQTEAEYNKTMKAVTPENKLAQAKVEEIEKKNLNSEAEVEEAGKGFEKELADAVKDVEAKKEVLKKDNAGNLYTRAQDVIAQPKYEALYKYINGQTTISYGIDITLKGKPSYGCLVVGPKLNEDRKITGLSKDSINKAMYIIKGKTLEEIEKELPETAEDFLKFGEVYAVGNISSKADYTKAFARVYENTGILKDKNGNPILDSNGRKQFAKSDMTSITFDIKTLEEIDEYNEKHEDEARKVEFITPDELEQLSTKLGSKECLDAEKASYWKYDYTKAKVKKPLIIAAAIAGAALVLGGGVYAYTQYQAQVDEISQTIKDGEGFDTNKAFEYGKTQVGDAAISYEYDRFGNVINLKATSSELTKDINAYEDRNNAKGWTDCGAIYQYVYNTTMNLGKDKNILQLDGTMLYDEYFAGLSLTTYEEETSGNWVIANAEAPKDANGKIISDLQFKSALDGYNAAAKELEKTNPETTGTSAIDPLDPALNDATQDRINKDTKGTKKTMVVEGVYVDFSKDTAFAVSNDGKNIVKLTYAEDIKTYKEAVDGMADTTSNWYTCAAANPNLPGERYQDYYVSDKTVKSGETYNKNIIEVEKNGNGYDFTVFDGYTVINLDDNKMPSGNDVAYVAIAGNSAHDVDYLAVGGAQGAKTVYTAQTPENTTTNTVGQIFGYVNPKTANVSDGMSK